MNRKKSRPQETLEFKKNKQLETFQFNPPKNPSEERKWLLAVTSLKATNSVLNITNENISFLVSTPGHWKSKNGEELINQLNNLLELRFRNDIELHVKGGKKRGTGIEIENSGCNLAGFDLFRSEICTKLKRIKYRDPEDMVYRMELISCRYYRGKVCFRINYWIYIATWCI